MASAPMLRLFLALPVPDEVAAPVTAIQCGLPGARWSPRENLHITLRFIGEVDEPVAEDVDRTLDGLRMAPFALSLAGPDLFGGEDPHALHLRVAPSARLDVLQGRCERACRSAGLAPETRMWTPHLTIAYLRHTRTDELAAYVQSHALFHAPSWTADRFHLLSSWHGRGPARYRIEAEYPLIG
jgi:RNA 2',3'-cyclic 3'-phosphodiesterase